MRRAPGVAPAALEKPRVPFDNAEDSPQTPERT